MGLAIDFISDTHGQHEKLTTQLTGGDVLCFCGDQAPGTGDLDQILAFNQWCGKLQYKKIFVIAGNHDFLFQEHSTVIKRYITNYTYLCDEAVTYKGVKFYGSPWQPWFHDWAFNLPRDSDEIANKWAAIPDDTEVLLTHGPPYGILDQTRSGENAGCKKLLERIKELKKLRIHAFGHIHEGRGQDYQDFEDNRNWPVGFINCSVLNEHYHFKYKPYRIFLGVNDNEGSST